MTPVERAAEAAEDAYRAYGDDGYPWEVVARAILLSLEEPSEAMVLAGQAGWSKSIIARHAAENMPLEYKLAAVEPFHFQAGWSEAIRAALEEKP